MFYSRVPKTFSPQTTGFQRNIKTGILMIWLQWALGAMLWADEFAITHFDASGRLTFTEVSGAASYRVEWSATLAPGSWTSEPPGIDSIPAEGSGERTVTVATGAGPSFFRVVAVMQPPPPEGFALIPEGLFQMGDFLEEGEDVEKPVHPVSVSAFIVQTKETTELEWDEVRTWATAHGYQFNDRAPGKGQGHPAHSINWYDIIKWCNARSEKEGLTPCYYTDAARTIPFRTGELDLTNDHVLWTANGYRLPTEAEWEKAARGGAQGLRYPWGNTISHPQANYLSDSNYAYDTSATRGYHPSFAAGGYPYTSPAGSFSPDGYGLYDMAGSVLEWCWDWYGDTYYSNAPASDPRGPASGSVRVLRGGSWNADAFLCRVAHRNRSHPTGRYTTIGFRAVRRR